MNRLPGEHVPRGGTLPITCEYPFSRGKPIHDSADLPEGWRIDLLAFGDPDLEVAGIIAPVMYLGTDEDGNTVASSDPSRGEPARFAYLRNAEGEIVATWDEGRWWTPEETEVFLELIRSEELTKVTLAAETLGLNRAARRRRR